jgi:hypothetical protein
VPLTRRHAGMAAVCERAGNSAAVASAIFLAIVLTTPVHAQIRKIEIFRDRAGHPAWNWKTGEIAFERDGEIWFARNDGRDACATCRRSLPNGKRISPAWRGSALAVIVVGDGVWSNGTRVAPSPGAADLIASRDGANLAWIESGTVRLNGEARPIQAESLSDFTADGKGLLLSAGNEIRECDIAGAPCRTLISKPGNHLDQPKLSADGRTLAYASTEGGWFAPSPLNYKTDIWFGTQRMTWFNEPQHPRYVTPAGARCLHPAWSLDGRTLLVELVSDPRPPLSRRILKLTLP